MGSPLLYLTLCSARNRILRRLKRLREPRYLVGSVVGLAYFYYFFFFRRPTRGPQPRAMVDVIAAGREVLGIVGALGLLLITGLAWFWPGERKAALGFTQSDVQFLFTAPIPRRSLIRYKVLRSQLGVFFGSAIMTVFFRPSSLASGGVFFLGMAVVMAVVNLHLTGIGLRRAQGRAATAYAKLGHRVPRAYVIVTTVAAIAAFAQSWPALTAADSATAVARLAQATASSGALGVLFWPFMSLARLPLATSFPEFVRLLPGPLALLVVNYVWVITADVPFEEASAAQAEKVAAARSNGALTPVVRSVRKAPFTLALAGRPEPAIVWKNLLMLGRVMSRAVLVRLLLIVGVMTFAFSRGANRDLVATAAILCVVLLAFTVLIGPQVVRNDLRRDLRQIEVLKAWPIRSAALVRGEILAPALVLSAVVLLLVVVGVVLSGSLPKEMAFVAPARFSYGLAVLAAAPGLILAQLTMQNAMAVMFPAWVVTGDTRARGIDVMGQRMLMLAGMLIVVVLAALPAAVAGGLVGYAIYAATGVLPVVVPAVIAGAAMVVECAMATEVLGAVLDRTDVSAVDPAH